MDSDPPSTAASDLTPSPTITAAQPDLVIARRFCGPPSSANGGYLSGRFAALLPEPEDPDGAVTVTLRTPPPLETPMQVREDGNGLRLLATDTLVAEAIYEPIAADCVDAVSYDEALEAAGRYPGRIDHPFPGCFVCGIDRSRGDGLCLTPGPVAPGRTAAAWTPDPSLLDRTARVGIAHVWAALDCPGGWTVDLSGRPMVLGRMTARVDALPQVGDQCVVMGQLIDHVGRKARTVTTLYDGDGRVLARARAVWIEVDPSAIAPR
jgi:hypothetical protein